jgi:hypothetical protein
MANRDSTTNEPASTIALEPLHKDFSWLPDNIQHDIEARFAAQVRTVAQGVGTIAQITQQHLIDRGAGARKLMSEGDLYSLVALIAPLMSALDFDAENQIDRLETAASKGAA